MQLFFPWTFLNSIFFGKPLKKINRFLDSIFAIFFFFFAPKSQFYFSFFFYKFHQFFLLSEQVRSLKKKLHSRKKKSFSHYHFSNAVFFGWCKIDLCKSVQLYSLFIFFFCCFVFLLIRLVSSSVLCIVNPIFSNSACVFGGFQTKLMSALCPTRKHFLFWLWFSFYFSILFFV